MGGSDLTESFLDLFYDESGCRDAPFCVFYLLESIGFIAPAYSSVHRGEFNLEYPTCLNMNV